jgi:branched-chain amino acid transport system ATP-binding protein
MLLVRGIDVFHDQIQALWGVSLEVREGELVSLIGANGAGKSTIVEAVAGLLPLSSGEITFNGSRLDRYPAHKIVSQGVSLIPEERGLFPGMSVFENLEMGAFKPESRVVRNETFSFVFELFPVLEKRKEQKAGTMSGGEQQMLAVGRALMSRPQLLMCDEPSLGLAPVIVKNIFKILRQINQSGVSILLVEQNVRAALDLAQRAYIIETGRVTGHGEADRLLDDDRVKAAYLGTG